MRLVTLIGIIILLPTLAFAQVSPEEFVNGMFKKYKEEGSAHAFLQFIHWTTAFAAMSDEDKAARGITTADELQLQYEAFYTDPTSFLESVMEPKLASVVPEKRDEVRAQLKQIAEAMLMKNAQMKEKITKSEYDVGDPKINGEQASVEVVSKLRGSEEKITVMVSYINGKWWLPGFSAIRSKSFGLPPPPTPAAPTPPKEAPMAPAAPPA